MVGPNEDLSARTARTVAIVRWAAVLAAVLLGASAHAEMKIIALGGLLDHHSASFATAISDDGSTVVGYSGLAANPLGWSWRADTGLIELPALSIDLPETRPLGLSADGTSIVGYATPATNTPRTSVLWTAGAPPTALPVFDTAYSISADGLTVVGTAFGASGPGATIWTSAGGATPLGDLPGGVFESYGIDVSADGSVVVGNGSPAAGGREAFRWTAAGGMEGLGQLPTGSSSSFAWGVSPDGSVIVGDAEVGGHRVAFKWTEAEGMTRLASTTSELSTSHAVDASSGGEVVVGFAQQGAVIWDAAGDVRLLADVLSDGGVDMTGWSLSAAVDVSADGSRITGHGLAPSGRLEAFLVVIPEPGTALLVGAGLLALARRRAQPAAASRASRFARRRAGSKSQATPTPIR